MKRHQLLLFLAFTALSIPLGFAQGNATTATDPKEALIIEILKVSGGIESFTPSIENFVRRYQQAYPELSAPEWDNIRTKMRSDLVQATVKVWAANYSENDLQAFLEFYRSPAGQKLTRMSGKISTQITTQSEQVGRDTDALIRWMAQKKQTPGQPEPTPTTSPSSSTSRSR